MTAPDGDRLPATNSGQETCRCGHGYGEHDNNFLSDEGCLNGWDGSLGSPPGCMCKGFRPAPQQPSAQEREEEPAIVHCEPWTSCPGHLINNEVVQRTKVWCTSDPYRPSLTAPMSEADSAGEDPVAVVQTVLHRECSGDGCAGHCLTEAETTVAALRAAGLLAASSGVRGGDDQARERLADVLAAVDNLDERGAPHLREGPSGKWKKKLSETLRTRGQTQLDAADFIRRAAGGGR